MAETRAQQNRKIRQEALREQLSKQKHLEQYVETLEKMSELDVYDDKFTNSLTKLKTINEQRLKIIDKYLPSEKPVEVSGDAENPLQVVTNIVLEALSDEG